LPIIPANATTLQEASGGTLGETQSLFPTAVEQIRVFHLCKKGEAGLDARRIFITIPNKITHPQSR
jgi:hypothetical protein